MNGRKLVRRTAFVAGGLLLSTVCWAQGGAAPASAGPQKVAVIDIRRAMTSTAEGKQGSAELQSKFAPRQTELENLNRQISDVQSRLNAGERTLSDDELNRLRRQGTQLSTQLERKRSEYQEDFSAEQADIVDRLGRKLLDVVDRYSRENGYVVVFDSSAQGGAVVYAANQIDITQDVIRLYDQTYPVKASASAPPAQPRPAQARPAQPQQKPPQQ